VSLLREIRRRKVLQVAAAYVVAAWVIIQVAATVGDPLQLPDYFETLVIVLLALGFPVVLILSWAFDVTPRGIVRDQGSAPSGEPGPEAAQGARRVRTEHVLVALLAVAATWILIRELGPLAVAEATPNSVAILPFEHLSLDDGDAITTQGIHASTLDRLQKIPGLTVIERTSVLRYADDVPPIPEVAAELNVEFVMVGSVRYDSDRVVIGARLVDGESGALVWSDEYPRDLIDIFDVQAEIGERIASAVHLQLTERDREAIRRPLTHSETALSAWQYALVLQYSEDFAPAIEALQLAVEADDDFAASHGLLASLYATRQQYGLPGDNDALGRFHARRAIELDPELGQAHAALGELEKQAGNWGEADRHFARVIGMNPNSADLLLPLIRFYGDQGLYAEGLDANEQLVLRDPLNATAHSSLALFYDLVGRHELAYEASRRAVEIDRTDAPSHAAFGLSATRSQTYVNLVSAYALAGERSEAERVVRQLEAYAVQNPVRPAIWALVHAALGNASEAMLEVERVIDDPVVGIELHWLRQNSMQLPLLDEPAFVDAREQIALRLL